MRGGLRPPHLHEHEVLHHHLDLLAVNVPEVGDQPRADQDDDGVLLGRVGGVQAVHGDRARRVVFRAGGLALERVYCLGGLGRGGGGGGGGLGGLGGLVLGEVDAGVDHVDEQVLVEAVGRRVGRLGEGLGGRQVDGCCEGTRRIGFK